MITVPAAFKQAISNSEKNYVVYADITLANRTVLNLTNVELWEGGSSREEAVSEDGKFTALGAAIIGSAQLSIKNQYEEYSRYDFTNAKVVTYISLEQLQNVSGNKIRTGTYTVDDAVYTEATITLTMLDNMEQFDRPYNDNLLGSRLTYPATIFQIVQNACLCCGVTLENSSIPQARNIQIPERPTDEGITYREVIGMAAAIAGYFCRCTPDGKLQLAWFDRTSLDAWRTSYANGTTLPAATRNKIHYITSLFSQDIGVDPITITGVRAVIEKTDEDNHSTSVTKTRGNTGYVIGIEKNDLLNACTDAVIDGVMDRLATQLIGLTFRKASISHSSDPTIEAGDIGVVWDRRDRGYPILITRTNFSAFDQQKTVCGAETPSRNGATRYSWQSKAYVATTKMLNQEQSIREQMEQDFREAFENAAGMYYTGVTENGATKYYLHNFPDLEDSPVIIEFSSGGIRLTSHGINAASNQWFGLTANGTMLVNLLRTTGFSFDWANGGTLTLGGQDNVNGQLQILNAYGTEIGRLDKDGADITGTLKMLGDTTFCTIGKTPTYVSYIVEGFVQRTLENLQYTIPYDSNGHVRATKIFVKADTGEIQEILALAGARARRFVLLTTGSYLPEINSSSDYVKVRGYEERVSYDSTKGAIYQLLTMGGTGHDLGLEIYKNHVKLGRFTCDGEARVGANRKLDLPGDSSSATIDGNTIAYTSSSSERYKHNINRTLTGSRDPHSLLKLPVAEFVFNDDHILQYADMRGKTIPGFIAEDVAKTYPAAVITDLETGRIESWDERRIIPGMLALIQEQQKTIEEQQKQLNRQQMQLNEMQSQMKELKELVEKAQDKADRAYRQASLL